MTTTRLLLALALATSAFATMPAADAADPVCDDRSCLVSVEWYVCVTEPCDGLVVCLAHGRVCSNDLLP